MDEIAVGLKRLGLTQYQSSALSTIIKNEGSTADFVSEGSEIPITKVYSVLQSLEYMNFIRASFERPKRYSSVGADMIFNSLIDKQKQTLVQLRKEARRTMKLINQNAEVMVA